MRFAILGLAMGLAAVTTLSALAQGSRMPWHSHQIQQLNAFPLGRVKDAFHQFSRKVLADVTNHDAY